MFGLLASLGFPRSVTGIRSGRLQQQRRLRAAAVNLTVCALSMVITVGAVEAALRIRQRTIMEGYLTASDPDRERRSLELHQRSADPLLVYETRPGAETSRDGTLYRINAQGLRRDSDIGPKHPGERRILVLGDSVAFGYGVDHQSTFTNLLEQRLADAGVPTTVLNQAVLGYRTEQEVRLYERRGQSLSPDGVVLSFCLNDFDVFSGEQMLLASGDYRRTPPRRLAGVDWPDRVPVFDRLLLFQKLTHHALRMDYYTWIGTDSDRRDEVAREFRRLSTLLKQESVPGLVVIFPILVEGSAARYPYEEIHRFVQDQARSAGFAVLDLLQPFRQADFERLRLRPSDVLHLSRQGHALAAELLANCLTDARLRCQTSD